MDIEAKDCTSGLCPARKEELKNFHFERAVCKNFTRCVIRGLQFIKISCYHLCIASYLLPVIVPQAR